MSVLGLTRDISAAPVSSLEAPAAPNPTLQKVKSVAFQALFWVGWTFAAILAVATVIPAGVAIVQKARSHYKLKATIQALAENRYTAVRRAIGKEIGWDAKKLNREELEKLPNSKGRSTFRRQIFELITMINYKNSKKSGLHDHMQEFRALLNEIIESPFYQENKDKKDNLYIKVVQAAAHALVSESPGMKPMQEYGAKAVGEVDEGMNYEELADALTKAVDQQTIFKKNTLIGKVFWIFVHPEKFLESALDQLGYTDPLAYNSYEHGNASVQVGKFEVKKRGFPWGSRATYSLTLAPTFVADRLTKADRDFGAKRLVQDLEANYTGHKGEEGRVAAKLATADDDLRVLNTPINIKKGEESDVGLDPKLSEILGWYFNDEKYDLEPKRREQAMRLAAVSLKALEEMIDMPLGSGDKYISQSCKQNIDRGVVVNAATILLADAIWGTEDLTKDLTEDRVHQIIGMVLVRAGMVDDRAILNKWFRSLTDLLKVMHQNPILVSNLQEHFNKKGQVAFKASDR